MGAVIALVSQFLSLSLQSGGRDAGRWILSSVCTPEYDSASYKVLLVVPTLNAEICTTPDALFVLPCLRSTEYVSPPR